MDNLIFNAVAQVRGISAHTLAQLYHWSPDPQSWCDSGCANGLINSRQQALLRRALGAGPASLCPRIRRSV